MYITTTTRHEVINNSSSRAPLCITAAGLSITVLHHVTRQPDCTSFTLYTLLLLFLFTVGFLKASSYLYYVFMHWTMQICTYKHFNQTSGLSLVWTRLQWAICLMWRDVLFLSVVWSGSLERFCMDESYHHIITFCVLCVFCGSLSCTVRSTLKLIPSNLFHCNKELNVESHTWQN